MHLAFIRRVYLGLLGNKRTVSSQMSMLPDSYFPLTQSSRTFQVHKDAVRPTTTSAPSYLIVACVRCAGTVNRQPSTVADLGLIADR